MIPESEWKWQGSAGHFICSDQCAYRLCTVVGDYVVSTVGDYYPVGGSVRETVGAGRLYETMVFRAAPCSHDDCDELHQADGHNLDMTAANTRTEARAAHLAMCRKWATK